jgi:trigger factor
VKVTVERMPQSSVSLDIVAESDEFNKAMDKAYRKISRQVRIPGFRPGKAPRLIVEQRLGREVIVEEAQREIMDGLYRQALEQEELTPVSEPSVDVYQDEPVGFKVEVQIYPTVDLNEYTDVRVEPQEINVSDEDVDEAISDIQKQNSIWKEPESQRSPQAGDQVIIDLQAYEGEEPFQDPVEDAEFEIGEGRLFPQIEEALKNVSAGEQAEFDITFDEDDEKANPDLRGKTLHYKVTLKEIKERELPEIDDELAKTAGYETLDAMRDTLRKNLLRTRAFQARTEVVNDAIQNVADQAILDVPSAMVVRQIDEDIARLQQELSREGMSFDEFLRFGNKTNEEYRDELKPDAERRLRNSLVLEAFAKAENVEVSEDDLLAEIDRLVGPAENAEQMRELYTNPYFSNMLRDELANRKVADRLLEIVTEGVGAVTGAGAPVFDEPEAVEESAEDDDEEVLTSDADSSEDDADSDDRDEADDDVEQTAAADTEAAEAAVAATAADENDTTDREPTGS